MQDQQRLEQERPGVRNMADPRERPERKQTAGAGDPEADPRRAQPGKDQKQARTEENQPVARRIPPEQAQHLRVRHPGRIAGHRRAAQQETEAGGGERQQRQG